MEPYENQRRRRLQVVFTQKMQERKFFMEGLKHVRQQNERKIIETIKKHIGPKWYQTLSATQCQALDFLKDALYRDLLEARPTRTEKVLYDIGLLPMPKTPDILIAMYYAKDNPKAMLVELYQLLFQCHYATKRPTYDLNSKLILSGIFYLGKDHIIELLRERFRPPKEEPITVPKKKYRPPTPVRSPYLKKVEKVYNYSNLKPKKPLYTPPPLPNLDELNELEEEDPPVLDLKPKIKDLPKPPTKKRLPRSYCDQIAGYIEIKEYKEKPQSDVQKPQRRKTNVDRIHTSKLLMNESKKVYGIGASAVSKVRIRKPKAPKTDSDMSQYIIKGVCIINGKKSFILDAVSRLPARGDLIHGGHVLIGKDYLLINCGYTAVISPPPSSPCDCVSKWQGPVFKYLKESKCKCGHYYDFGHEERFDPQSPQYFVKPSRKGAPMQFNFNLIYETDPKIIHIEKEMKKLWDTDSVLMLKADDDAIIKKVKKKRVTGLGDNPTISDYLRLAVQAMRRAEIAASLPDVYLAPELQEWMRYRLYGPITRKHKAKAMIRDGAIYTYLQAHPTHVSPKQVDEFQGKATTWRYKQQLNDKFKKYREEYKCQLYRTQCNLNNQLWVAMNQKEHPSKRFQQIFFAYIVSDYNDLFLINPYDQRESAMRRTVMMRKRYCCPVEGADLENFL